MCNWPSLTAVKKLREDFVMTVDFVLWYQTKPVCMKEVLPHLSQGE